VQHPRELDVGGVARLPASPFEPVHLGRRAPDDLAWPGRPRLDRILLVAAVIALVSGVLSLAAIRGKDFVSQDDPVTLASA